MDEERKLDHLLLELRSATGKIKADNIIAMYPSQSLQDERRELLSTLITNNHVGCSSDAFEDTSDVWLTEEGLQFLMNGGYRKRKGSNSDKEEVSPRQKAIKIAIYAVPLIFLIVLLLILFQVI